MKRYHIKKDGTPGECHAQFGKCPLGGANEHYPSMESAQAAADLQHMEEFAAGGTYSGSEREQLKKYIGEAVPNAARYTSTYLAIQSYKSNTDYMAGLQQATMQEVAAKGFPDEKYSEEEFPVEIKFADDADERIISEAMRQVPGDNDTERANNVVKLLKSTDYNDEKKVTQIAIDSGAIRGSMDTSHLYHTDEEAKEAAVKIAEEYDFSDNMEETIRDSDFYDDAVDEALDDAYVDYDDRDYAKDSSNFEIRMTGDVTGEEHKEEAIKYLYDNAQGDTPSQKYAYVYNQIENTNAVEQYMLDNDYVQFTVGYDGESSSEMDHESRDAQDLRDYLSRL